MHKYCPNLCGIIAHFDTYPQAGRGMLIYEISTVSIQTEEIKTMENKTANYCIACTVTQCRNHVKTANYCALDKIQVGTHESNPTVSQCTDCESFVVDKSCDHCNS